MAHHKTFKDSPFLLYYCYWLLLAIFICSKILAEGFGKKERYTRSMLWHFDDAKCHQRRESRAVNVRVDHAPCQWRTSLWKSYVEKTSLKVVVIYFIMWSFTLLWISNASSTLRIYSHFSSRVKKRSANDTRCEASHEAMQTRSGRACSVRATDHHKGETHSWRNKTKRSRMFRQNF